MPPHPQRSAKRDRAQLPLDLPETMSARDFRELVDNGKISKAPVDKAEGRIQRSIIALLRAKGWRVIRINGGGWYVGGRYVPCYRIAGLNISKGFSDLLALRGDGSGVTAEALLIEVKKPGGKLRESQELVRDYFALTGIPTHTFDSWHQALNLVETL